MQALIFDVDGTLADTERDGHREAFNLAFRDFDLDWHWDEALYGELLAVTGGKERIRFFVDQVLDDYSKPADFDDLVKDIHARKTRHYVTLLGEGRIGLRPGVARVLDEARRAGLRLAIATTTTPDNVEALLDSTLGRGASSRFEVIGAGDVVARKKPSPDIYHYVLDAMSVASADCLALEDSANGLRAARGAGVPTVITVNGYTAGEPFDGAVAVLDSLGEPRSPSRVIRGAPLADADYVTVDGLNALWRRAER